MELLQTILNALTTPNEGLVNLLGTPLTLLDAYVGMILFTTILNIGSTKKQRIIYVITFSLVGIITNFLLPNLYAKFIIMILCPILIILILKSSILKGILSEVIILTITACLDFIISKIIFFCF